ncbi:MAG: calcium-binding protein, partial [Mycobacteriales bacterium]
MSRSPMLTVRRGLAVLSAATLTFGAWSVSTVTQAASAAATPSLTCFGHHATIVGTAKDDDITGTSGADVIVTFGGNDTINAGSGDDLICTGGGNDAVHGGAGNDKVDAGSGKDTVLGGQGADTISGGTGGDRLSGNLGTDVITGGSGTNFVNGGGGNDRLSGGAGNDYLVGGPGDDIEQGGAGDDSVTGGTGDDMLRGGSGDDQLQGNSGTDALHGGDGDDWLHGGAGSDNLFGEAGEDNLQGNDPCACAVPHARGDDTENGGGGNDTIYVWRAAGSTPGITVDLPHNRATGDGTQKLVDIESAHVSSDNQNRLIGDAHDNTFASDGGANDVTGGGGDDTYFPGSEQPDPSEAVQPSDTFDGGAGSDTINFRDVYARGGVFVDLQVGVAHAAHPASFTSVENVTGSRGDDNITGDDGANVLRGGSGNDIIEGAGGNDSVYGGQGDDELAGGVGDDLIDGGDPTVEILPTDVDKVSYLDSPNPVTLNLATGKASGNGNDTLVHVEDASGSLYDDTIAGDDQANGLAGDAGDDTINGAGGNDYVVGCPGDDRLDGGLGEDTISYKSSPAAVTVDLAAGTGTGQGTDTLTGFEDIIGSVFADTLSGDDSNNRIHGGYGDDVLNGRGGNDD